MWEKLFDISMKILVEILLKLIGSNRIQFKCITDDVCSSFVIQTKYVPHKKLEFKILCIRKHKVLISFHIYI